MLQGLEEVKDEEGMKVLHAQIRSPVQRGMLGITHSDSIYTGPGTFAMGVMTGGAGCAGGNGHGSNTWANAQ